MKVGLNLYSIRKLIGTEEDFLNTALKLKEMGYDFLQYSGAAFDAERIKRVSEATGMPVVLTHVQLDRIINDTEKLVEEHNVFGCKNIGLGGMSGDTMRSDDTWKETLDKLEIAAQKIEALGSKFFFHQHHYEAINFEDGTTPFDYIVEKCPHINITVDSYWVQYSGYNCLEYVDRIKGRMECVHLKDYKINRVLTPEGKPEFKPRYTPCGNGTLPFPSIIKKWREECGTKYFLVEQDDAVSYPDPMAQVEMSVKYLKSLDL